MLQNIQATAGPKRDARHQLWRHHARGRAGPELPLGSRSTARPRVRRLALPAGISASKRGYSDTRQAASPQARRPGFPRGVPWRVRYVWALGMSPTRRLGSPQPVPIGGGGSPTGAAPRPTIQGSHGADCLPSGSGRCVAPALPRWALLTGIDRRSGLTACLRAARRPSHPHWPLGGGD